MMLKFSTTALLLGLPIIVTAANTDASPGTTRTAGLRGLYQDEYYGDMHPDTGAYCWEEHEGYMGMSDNDSYKGHEGSDYKLYTYEPEDEGDYQTMHYEKPSYGQGSSGGTGHYEYQYEYEYEYHYGYEGMDDDGDDHVPYPQDIEARCREACEKEDWCMAYFWSYGSNGPRCELWTHWTGYTDHSSGNKCYVKVKCGSSSSTGKGYGYDKDEDKDDHDKSSRDYDNYDDDSNRDDDDSGRDYDNYDDDSNRDDDDSGR